MKKTYDEAHDIQLKAEGVQKNLAKGVVFAAIVSCSAFATTNTQDSFGDIYTVFKNWLTGDLGRLIALLGFAITVFIYLTTHKGTVLLHGAAISLLAGGIVSISTSFFNLGVDTFNIY